MIPFNDLMLFAGAALFMVLTPGPNMIYLISRSISQGRRAGVISLFGVVAGFFVHMFAAAIGFTDGLRPNLDFFAQYGPLSSVVQGLGMMIFGKTLTGLRLFTTLLLIFSALMVGFRTHQKFGQRVALLTWSLWVLSGPMGLPWSSIISSSMIVVFLFLSFSFHEERFVLNSSRFLYSSQLLIVGSLVRIQVSLIFILLLAVIIFRRLDFPRHFLRNFLLLSCITFSAILLSLAQLKILNPYVEQSFIWAIGHYGKPRITLTYISGLIWFALVPVFLVTYAWLIRWVLRKNYFSRNAVLLLFSIPLLASFLITISYENEPQESLLDPAFFAIEFLRRILISVDYLPVFAIICLLFLFMVAPSRKIITRSKENCLILAVAVGTLSQLYPLFDPWHLWMISPVLILAIVLLDFRLVFLKRLQLPFYSIAVTVIIGLISQFIVSAFDQHYSFKSEILSGMTSSRLDAPQLDSTLLKLEKSMSPNKPTVFLCTDGLYAAASGYFISQGPIFVDWGLTDDLLNSQTRRVFACDYTKGQVRDFEKSDWETVFVLDSGHVNSSNERLFNVLMDRK